MAGSFNNTDIDRIQQANDIVEVVAEHISLRRKGKEMVGLCPFHEDHRPSLNVNPTKQIFKCFACGAGGDVFKFVQMRENLTFGQAVERLAQRAGIKLEPRRPRQPAAEPETDPNELARVNEWAAKYFQKNLNDPKKGELARVYLNERRIGPEAIRKWRIGLALDTGGDLIKAAKTSKVPTKLLADAGLVAGASTGNIGDRFVNRLMFTITDATGRVVGFGGRTLDGRGAKYINSPTTALFDKSHCLYGLEHARQAVSQSGTAVVVEGYTDCIMAHAHGITNVVATLGTSLTAGHARILKRYARKIVLVFDNDIAGIEAANRALEICVAQRVDIKITSVPQGKDPCDFLLAEGKESFQRLIDSAEDIFAFKWKRLTEKFAEDKSIVENKAAVEEFLQTVATAVAAGNLSAIDRGLLANRIGSIVGLDQKAVTRELNRRARRLARTQGYGRAAGTENQKVVSFQSTPNLAAAAQREIIEVLLNEPKLVSNVKQHVDTAAFDVPELREIAEILLHEHENGREPQLRQLLTLTESNKTASVMVELADEGEKKGNFEARLAGALEVLGRVRNEKIRPAIKATDDQREYLRRIAENVPKQNPHNVGMV